MTYCTVSLWGVEMGGEQQLCERYVWRACDVYACKGHGEVWWNACKSVVS